MPFQVNDQKRLNYLIKIASDYANKGFVQDVKDTLAIARRFDEIEDTARQIEQRAIFNGIFNNVLDWARKYSTVVINSGHTGFNPRLFAFGMLKLAKIYEQQLDDTVLRQLNLAKPYPVEPLQLPDGEIRLSDLEDLIESEIIDDTNLISAGRFNSLVNGFSRDGWITATQGGIEVLKRYQIKDPVVSISPNEQIILDMAVSVNYRNKLTDAVRKARDVLKSEQPRKREAIEEHFVRASVLSENIPLPIVRKVAKKELSELKNLLTKSKFY